MKLFSSDPEQSDKNLLFLDGVFSLKEKSPTIAEGSSFQFTLNGPLFVQFCNFLVERSTRILVGI